MIPVINLVEVHCQYCKGITNMQKKITMPAFMLDYTSLWNPMKGAFISNIMGGHDKCHIFEFSRSLGLQCINPSPMIDLKVLLQYGGRQVKVKKGEVLFRAGSEAMFYYQILEGSVKMITASDDGQEFIQGIFKNADSFGEPPLFCDFAYPSSAIAIEDSEIIKLAKVNFFELLRDNFEIHLKFDRVLCHRLKYKSMILSDMSFYDPEQRISNLLKYLKDSNATKQSTPHMLRFQKPYVVPFTRQQLADMSGLRVETVIRTVKKMQEKGKLNLVGRKISI